MKTVTRIALLAYLPLFSVAWAQNSPAISLVANAEGEKPLIAPNTWVEIKGQNLSKANDTRTWQAADFVNNQMPTSLDGVSVTVNGKSAFVYYISPTQVNVLTPPDAMSGPVVVQVTRSGAASAPFTVSSQALSPSFFVFNGGPYAIATHLDGSLAGPASLYPGSITPAKPGETIVVYANGFGPTSPAAVSGSITQSGTISPLPTVTIGGVKATVGFAGLISPGLFQLNVVIPGSVPSGDNPVIATINGTATTPAALITVQGSAPAPASITFYVAPNGNDNWSGRLAAPNSNNTDGPFATVDQARAFVQSIVKAGLTSVIVQIRGGTYHLPATVMFTAADSGSPGLSIVYQNYPGESPILSGGVRVQNWTNTSGNTWKATLPANTQYFENLFYNGARRLRPRLGGSSGALGAYYRIGNTIYLNAAPPPAAAPEANCAVYISGSGWECFDRFQYNKADPIVNTWKNLAPAAGNPCGQPAGNPALAGDIQLLVWEQFSTSKLRISCVDAANQIVYLTGPTGMSQNNASEEGFITGNRYLIENIQDQLTQPGQWFLDHSVSPWTLTYLANSGENPNNDTVVIPQVSQLLVASNLQHVTFQGLTFEHDNYTLPPVGHVSSELEPDIGAAVSFQNSQHITFDSGTVTQTSGSGLEFIPCINPSSPAYCIATDINAVVTGNLVENSAFYDIGALGIRIGNPFQPADTDANVPQLTTVENNVVEGYGRNIPASFGIGQGMGHDNLYTHNDVYDGYHCAISTSQSISTNIRPSGIGNANNVISFNHVYNLLQGIMNDGGSIRIDGGNAVFTAAGNKILNNKIHDVTDASIMDANGYGGHGAYMDDHTGLVDVENNLIYRVSGAGVYTPHGPTAAKEANTIKNNIVAFARLSNVSDTGPYVDGIPASVNQAFVVSNNLFYFDRNEGSGPPFRSVSGCTYSLGFPFASFLLFSSNLYWRTDGGFASDAKAFHVQPNPGTGANAPCSDDKTTWTFYSFSGWQGIGEDLQSVVQNPGFANPAYPADDYSLPKGSPGAGFVVFDPNQAGRTNPVMKPPAIAATFPTKNFNPATDY
ncbi:MAG TPA: IPT/TIG domain-containing protein [Bryobacteraceae bacterium]|nr:IPT/TIG domain-containing protein [Bryobacteraceae bacterium]